MKFHLLGNPPCCACWLAQHSCYRPLYDLPSSVSRNSKVHLSPEKSTLLFVRRALGDCVYLAVMCDTRDVQLSEADRFNCYPATPFPSVSWILDGQLHMVEGSGEHAPTLGGPLPNVIFSGSIRSPSVSWPPGTIHVLNGLWDNEAAQQTADVRLVGRAAPTIQCSCRPLSVPYSDPTLTCYLLPCS